MRAVLVFLVACGAARPRGDATVFLISDRGERPIKTKEFTVHVDGQPDEDLISIGNGIVMRLTSVYVPESMSVAGDVISLEVQGTTTRLELLSDGGIRLTNSFDEFPDGTKWQIEGDRDARRRAFRVFAQAIAAYIRY